MSKKIKQKKFECENLKEEAKYTSVRMKKGITLIALVVTIVVLLILASVSITVVFGDNGILSQAIKSKENTNDAYVIDQITIIATNYGIDRQTGSDKEKAYINLRNSLMEGFEATKNDDGTVLITGNYKGKYYEYCILENGNVVSTKLIDRITQGDYVNYNSSSLSGGESWRCFYTENNSVYLISTNPTEIVQATNNGVEETFESVNNFANTFSKERNTSVSLIVGLDSGKFPLAEINTKNIDYSSNLSDYYKLSVTLEDFAKVLNMNFNIGESYDYQTLHERDINNLFTLSKDCYYLGTYFGNVGNDEVNKNCIYMWWSNSGGIGPCWALQSSFSRGTKIRPVVKLKENVKIISGNGSIEYPFEITISEN